MINDTLAELANMAAGQLKGMLHLQNSLGLPIVKPTSEYRAKVSTGGGWSHHPMKAGVLKVLLSITTETSVAEEYALMTKILTVDDSRAVRTIIAKTLKSKFDIVEAEDGEKDWRSWPANPMLTSFFLT